MLFAFEDIENLENFTSCRDINESGIRRFSPSPIATTMVRIAHEKYRNISISEVRQEQLTESSKNYIYASGVNHSPNDWCGNISRSTRKSLFEYIPKKVLTDLQNREAILLLDQSHEGYQTPWLWDWFHREMQKFSISPQQLIYVTGNLDSRTQYQQYCDKFGILSKIYVAPYTHFERMIYDTMLNRVRIEKREPTPSFKDHVTYKKNNLHKIKTYNLLQKRLRAHRMWTYKYFHDADLLDSGLVSMNPIDPKRTIFEMKELSPTEVEFLNLELPKILYGKPNNVGDDLDYIVRFNDQTVLDSWVSVVSEASFGDREETCFLSEKTFKSIACNHPFIVIGNRGSLSHLRNMGYKTFSGFIDESYDDLPTWERMTAIVNAVKKIDSIDDKMGWFLGMQEIIDHNYKTLMQNSLLTVPSAMVEIKEYFGISFDV